MRSVALLLALFAGSVTAFVPAPARSSRLARLAAVGLPVEEQTRADFCYGTGDATPAPLGGTLLPEPAVPPKPRAPASAHPLQVTSEQDFRYGSGNMGSPKMLGGTLHEAGPGPMRSMKRSQAHLAPELGSREDFCYGTGDARPSPLGGTYLPGSAAPPAPRPVPKQTVAHLAPELGAREDFCYGTGNASPTPLGGTYLPEADKKANRQATRQAPPATRREEFCYGSGGTLGKPVSLGGP